MLRVSGMHLSRLAPTAQARLVHHPLDSLMIDLTPISLQGFGHSTITITGKILPQLLQRQAQGSITVILDRATAMLVIPLPVDVEQRTQFAH